MLPFAFPSPSHINNTFLLLRYINSLTYFDSSNETSMTLNIIGMRGFSLFQKVQVFATFVTKRSFIKNKLDCFLLWQTVVELFSSRGFSGVDFRITFFFFTMLFSF